MTNYTHVAFATDFSVHSERAANRAVAVAEAHGATLSAVHVVALLHPSYMAFQLPSAYASMDAVVDVATKEFDDWLARRGIAVANRWLASGSTSGEILKLPESQGVDLLVIGTSGVGVAHALLGSTALGVVTNATCDVLIVTPQ